MRWNWLCKIFSLKIRRCKILDKFHVCPLLGHTEFPKGLTLSHLNGGPGKKTPSRFKCWNFFLDRNNGQIFETLRYFGCGLEFVFNCNGLGASKKHWKLSTATVPLKKHYHRIISKISILVHRLYSRPMWLGLRIKGAVSQGISSHHRAKKEMHREFEISHSTMENFILRIELFII